MSLPAPLLQLAQTQAEQKGLTLDAFLLEAVRAHVGGMQIEPQPTRVITMKSRPPQAKAEDFGPMLALRVVGGTRLAR